MTDLLTMPTLAIELGPDGFWWTNLLVLVSVYALLGLSLNLINGYARMFSLGHHGFWAMGPMARRGSPSSGRTPCPARRSSS